MSKEENKKISYQNFTNPPDDGVYRDHPIPPDPPIPVNSETVPNRHPAVAKEKPDRYGFYIPPSIGKSEIIRNIPRPVYVDAITTPNPPSFQKEPIPSADEVRGFFSYSKFYP